MGQSEFTVSPDFSIQNHFTVFLICPFSQRARAWIAEFVQPEAQYFGSAIAVEPRYVADLLEGMLAAGLTMACERGRAQ